MEKSQKKRSVLARLRNNFIAGVVVLIPIGITVYLTLFIIKISSKILPKELNPNHYLPYDIPGVEIIISIILITFIGWLSLSLIGKKLLEIFNNILKRIPILRTIYSAFVQMLDIFNKSDENKKNVVLGILTADCAPIIIYDPKLKIISAIHAGWKGAYKEIIKKVVNFLIKSGSDTKDLVAAIGPCIAQKNYEIKSDFKLKFLKQNTVNRTFFKKIKKKTYFSLNKYVYYQLKSLGLKKIDLIDKDTYNPKNNFFSARRAIHNNQNDYGRNISLIMIK